MNELFMDNCPRGFDTLYLYLSIYLFMDILFIAIIYDIDNHLNQASI
jgi:hypothetical protein